MLKKSLMSLSFVLSVFLAGAQETDYTDVTFDYQMAPSLIQYSNYKSFDLTVLTTKEEQDKPGTGFNMTFQPKVGNLALVNEGGDFHVVSLLQKYGGKMTSPATADINVALSSTVYDKYGNIVKTGSVNNEHFAVNFGRNLSKEEMGNADLIRKLCMEKILEASLQVLTDGINGAKLKPETRLASLDDVKKKPELQEFDVQLKALRPVIEKEGLPGFKKAAEPFVTYWEKMSAYSGEGDVEEVKRAALHNLALFYIASANTEKAKEYIEQYKPIDKTIKALFGLVKFKNSEELEKLIATIYPAAEEAAPVTDANGKIVTKAEVADSYQYLTVNGTVTVSGKRDAGTYNGLIKLNKIPANSFGNIVSLDPENIAVIINIKDDAGQSKVIRTVVSKVDALKDNNGTSYISEKYGTSVLGSGASYYFMQSTFTSPKVTVYRAVIPASSHYVVRKTGDDKGVKSSMFSAWKNLEGYLNDCASLNEKIKSGAIDKKASVEKIAEEYSKCQ